MAAETRSETNYSSWDSHAAVALAALGETAEALQLAEQGLEPARQWGAPGRLGHALRALGMTLGGDPGIARLKESVELLRAQRDSSVVAGTAGPGVIVLQSQ